MGTWVIFTIVCVAIGFLVFGAALQGFMQKWKSAITWVLCLAVFLFATVIPAIIALAYASSTSMQDAG